ncbi:MAG: Na+/H+ dicarboxylate symporter [Moraxellaceae bacterium]|jgi:Na+/H+-dicarboxylate symporter|nr:Na+/H+ dicarboxylate symporter [Moraxellaceae bacterium]
MPRLALHWQILIAIALGGVAGLWLSSVSLPADHGLMVALKLIGQLFMNALRLLVIPLVVSSIILGVSSLGEEIGRMGGNTFAYYIGSSLAAVIIGVVCVNLIAPGIVNGAPLGSVLPLPADTSAALAKVQDKSLGDVLGLFTSMVPPNLFGAALEGNMLGLIVFSLLYGYFMGRLPAPQREAQQAFWGGAQHIMISMTQLVLRFAPAGVFALIATTLASTGFAALLPMLWFFLTVLLALGLHMFGAISLFLWRIARVSPRRHLQAMVPALLTAFSTASSTATLPVTLRALRERAGVSERVSGMSAPLGASMNMDGTALYECAAALFLAQAYGLDLSLAQQVTVVLIALLTGFGMAGIPAASLVAIAVILAAIGLPLEALGLLLITDRLLDMCRTAVNVYSDSVAAVFVASREGEALPLLRPDPTPGA